MTKSSSSTRDLLWILSSSTLQPTPTSHASTTALLCASLRSLRRFSSAFNWASWSMWSVITGQGNTKLMKNYLLWHQRSKVLQCMFLSWAQELSHSSYEKFTETNENFPVFKVLVNFFQNFLILSPTPFGDHVKISPHWSDVSDGCSGFQIIILRCTKIFISNRIIIVLVIRAARKTLLKSSKHDGICCVNLIFCYSSTNYGTQLPSYNSCIAHQKPQCRCQWAAIYPTLLTAIK